MSKSNGNLVVSVSDGEPIYINGNISLMVELVRKGKYKLVIQAPPSVPILRSRVADSVAAYPCPECGCSLEFGEQQMSRQDGSIIHTKCIGGKDAKARGR